MAEQASSRSNDSPTPPTLWDRDESYERYLATLTPCPECGCVDEMDNIERGPFPLCAACYLDQNDADEWDEFDDDEELAS